MAFEKVRAYQYIADTKDDLKLIPEKRMGIECFVIKEASEYKLMSTGEWIKQTIATGGAGGDIDLSDYATEQYVDKAIAESAKDLVTKAEVAESLEEKADDSRVNEIEVVLDKFKKEIATFYRPLKYKISDVPEGTIIDYDREKEIRIFCPPHVKFHKQAAVGEGGNANIYYMTFTSYAPEGAVSLREGDKGVIVDELISLSNGSGTGVDEFGRKYKNHWFALAMYDETLDVWTYFGNNSTTEKYIGWTYVVEWYDKDRKLIDVDRIRINLSNASCHLTDDDDVDTSIDELTIWSELNEEI